MAIDLSPYGSRRLTGGPKVKKRVDIPADLVYRFEKLPQHFDASRQEAIFGHWSAVMSELLKQYILTEERKLAEKSNVR